jgi:hypothetical protein
VRIDKSNDLVKTKIKIMKDMKGILMWILYVTELVVSVQTVFFLDVGSGYFMPLVVLGILAGLAFIVMSLYEVLGSARIAVSEKIMWIVTLVLISNLAGIIYLIFRKKRILQQATI